MAEAAIQKRQLISKANRTMFIWVAGASAIIGFAIVVSIFVFQKAMFGEKVLAEKSKTLDTLQKSNKNVEGLKENIRLVNTSQALSDAMAPGQTRPIQTVLDALPSVGNSSAFGASLQQKILQDPRITIDTLRVMPIAGTESGEATVDDSLGTVGSNEIAFQFSIITGVNDPNPLKDALNRVERSIRPINIKKVVIERQTNRIVLTATGVTYYEPARTTDLQTKVVKP